MIEEMGLSTQQRRLLVNGAYGSGDIPKLLNIVMGSSRAGPDRFVNANFQFQKLQKQKQKNKKSSTKLDQAPASLVINLTLHVAGSANAQSQR